MKKPYVLMLSAAMEKPEKKVNQEIKKKSEKSWMS